MDQQPQKKEYLKFIVDNTVKITEYGSRNMEFFCAPKDFLGKNIINVLPLSSQDSANLTRGICQARQSPGFKIHESYSVKDQKFSAIITYKEALDVFSVKVQPRSAARN